jgi:Methyl-CpG binding domain.
MSSAEKKQPSVGVSDASASRKETKQTSETVKETGNPSSSPKKKKQTTKTTTTTKSSNKPQGKRNISHQDRLRLGVERIKQSSTYWKEEPVEDPRLAGWRLHLCKRASGHMDKYWFTPTGIKLRSNPEVEKFLLALQDANGDEDEAYTLLSKNRKRRSMGVGGAAPKSINNTASGADSSAKETASTGALSTQRQKKTKKSEKTSQEQTATATKTTNNATVTTPTRSSSRKKKISTAMTTEDGIDYSMTSAVQSVSASKKKRNVRRKERVIKHTSAAKDAKRVRSATVAAVLQQQKSKYATIYERDQIHGHDSFMNANAAQSIVFKRIQRMKHNSNHTGPYRLHYQDANITDQFAEPKFIEVKKATKKKAAKGLQVFSPVRKFDIPAVAESK